MSLDKLVRPTSLKTAAAMSADVFSDPFNILTITDYALQFVWSAGSTPIGTVTLQYSNDKTNWDTATSSLDVTGNSGSHTIKGVAGPVWVRGYYARTSGNGTLSIDVAGRGFH